MYHLFVTTKASNSKRSNLPFCIVESPFWELGGSSQGIDYQSQDCFEPRDLHKGNVARAMFYFSVRYQLPIDEDQEVILRKWNDLDPVDDREIERAKIIEVLQGNSNPFITDPELAHEIKDF
jgi:endonuclease I